MGPRAPGGRAPGSPSVCARRRIKSQHTCFALFHLQELSLLEPWPLSSPTWRLKKSRSGTPSIEQRSDWTPVTDSPTHGAFYRHGTYSKDGNSRTSNIIGIRWTLSVGGALATRTRSSCRTIMVTSRNESRTQLVQAIGLRTERAASNQLGYSADVQVLHLWKIMRQMLALITCARAV